MKVLTYAPDALRYLNGFVCLYKPAGLSGHQTRSTLVYNITRDLNAMETRSPRSLIQLEGSVASGKPLAIRMTPSYADHPLVVGPRYQTQDIRCVCLNFLGRNMSGIQLYSLNDGCAKALKFKAKSHLQVIEIKGKFGFATDTHFEDGKVAEKATYSHITQQKLDALLASIQFTHQAQSFNYAGVSIETQEAYNLASEGLLRPSAKSPTLLYNISCTEFSLPNFTLKIHCYNGSEDYLVQLIHEIGIYLRSCAVCCQLRQIQLDHFTLEHALIRKHWTVEHLITNITLCERISSLEEVSPTGHRIRAVDKKHMNQVLQAMQESSKMDVMESDLD